MSETVIVKNPTRIKQLAGIWTIPPGGTERIPLSVALSWPTVEIVRDVPAARHHLAMYRSLCKPDCGHSLCLLSRGLVDALHALGVDVTRQDWRRDIDQKPLPRNGGKAGFANSATFSGPSGSWAWLSFDNDRAPRQHVRYFLDNWHGNICVSAAVRDALVASGVPAKRLAVVPNAINIDLYRPDGPVLDAWGDKFVFLTVGAMSPRKGLDVALDAYGQAFTARDSVLLVVKNYDYGRDKWCRELIAEWQKRVGPKAPGVEYIYQTWSDEQIAAAYRRAAKHGAYLMPSRVEGFGITGLEAMACGCRLGATGWSGQLEYATPENSTLFGFDLQPSQNNLALYQPDEKPQWAELHVGDVVAWMTRVAKEQPNRVQQAEIAEQVRQQFTFEAMARGVCGALGIRLGESAVLGGTARSPRPPVLARDFRPSAPQLSPIIRDETFGIGIPTRDRPGYLFALLGALYCQTRRPQAICVVDDGGGLNADPAMVQMKERWEKAGTRFEIAKGTSRGASPNHQVALETLRTDLVLRLDDDLLPARPDFLDRLYHQINRRPEVGAVGGVYPLNVDDAEHHWAREGKRPGMTNRIDDLLAGKANLQFWNYADETLVECEHLYSSWVYRARYLQEAGGFPDCYSRLGQREETDASIRLYLSGYKLLVDTQALAWHFLAKVGGRRPEVSRQLVQQDDALFRERLTEWRRAAVS